MRTPTEHIRVEAKRMAKDLEKRRIAGTLTLAQEESMEQWLALARWAEQPLAHLPYDLCPLADAVIQRRWRSHNNCDRMLRELFAVDANAALRGACYCVLLVLAEQPTGYQSDDIERAQAIIQAALKRLAGESIDLAFRHSGVSFSSGADACLSAIFAMRTGDRDVRECLKTCAYHARSFGLVGSSRAYDIALRQRQKRLCDEIRARIECPPASEWVRAEVGR